MFVKRFDGPTVKAALEAAKRELGEEALLLSTRSDPDGTVRVTVAVERPAPPDAPPDEEFPGLPDLADEIIGASGKSADFLEDEEDPFADRTPPDSVEDAPERRVPAAALVAEAERERRERGAGHEAGGEPGPLHSEIPAAAGADGMSGGPEVGPGEPNGEPADFDARFLILSRRVEELARGLRAETGSAEPAGAFAVPSFEEIVGRLEATGLDRELAKGAARVVIARSGEDFESEEIFLSVLAEGLAGLVEPDVPPEPQPEGGPRVIAVIGPNGTGKTTTAAKIAAVAHIVHGKSAALVGADDYRIGAADQLLEHAGLIGTVFERASTPEELQGLLQALHEFDLVVVDTAGFPPSDGGRMWELARLLDGAPGVLPLLVVSASTRGKDLAEAIQRFRALGGLRLVVTKLDETDCYGEIFGEVAASGCPVAYLSAGQAVPEDIEECTPRRLAELVVRAAWTGRKANQ